MDKELCGKSYELANGHFATCHLPKAHEGRCTGFLTGEMAGTVILWDGKYESEEYQYLKENINKLKGDAKMKKWLLEARLESGMGVNQVKVGELMDGCKSDDECKEIISTLLDAGETKEYKENVFLRLGEFEGATLEDAFNKYFEEFDGDDQNELFFMHQIDAKELASSGCACGGSCGGHNRCTDIKRDDIMLKLDPETSETAKGIIATLSDEEVLAYLWGDFDKISEEGHKRFRDAGIPL